MLMPINMDLLFLTYGAFFYGYGVYLHWGYELRWPDAHHPWINTSFQHYLHHARSTLMKPLHTGFFFKIWDKMAGSVYEAGPDECLCARCAIARGERTREAFDADREARLLAAALAVVLDPRRQAARSGDRRGRLSRLVVGGTMVVSYRQTSLDERWDAIVIGSGLGGLAIASLLARHAGRRVLVLERHYTMGGFTHVFRRPGWEWDVGVHYVGQLEGKRGLAPLFEDITGGRLHWARLPEVYDEVHLGERAFPLLAGRTAFHEALAEHFPRERSTIARYLELLRTATADLGPFFAERALPRRLSPIVGPLLTRRAGQWLDRTVEQVLRPEVRDPLLFDVLTAQWGDYGLPPSQASFAMQAMIGGHYLRGAYYPVGGAGAIAASIEPEIEATGGRVVVRGEVSEIVLERGRAVGVKMADGRVLRAPVIVSDAGARNTWERLVPREDAERTGLPARIRAIEPSVAHLCLHLGLRGTDRELGLTGTNLWIYPEGDRDQAIARFRADPEHAPFPVVYASFPSAKDPTWAERYPGKSTIEVITPAWPEWLSAFSGTRWHKRGAEYDGWKARMTERLLDVLERHRPGVRARIEHSELSTPLSTAHFTNHAAGEMYGLSHTPARFRLPLRAATPIDGLYFTGQDLLSCGIGGAISAGAVCAGAILCRDPAALARTRLRGARAATARA